MSATLGLWLKPPAKPQVLGALLEAALHLRRDLSQELLAVGRVREDRDGEVEAGEGSETGRNPEQLAGQLQALPEQVEVKDLVAGVADPVGPELVVHDQDAEDR